MSQRKSSKPTSPAPAPAETRLVASQQCRSVQAGLEAVGCVYQPCSLMERMGDGCTASELPVATLPGA